MSAHVNVRANLESVGSNGQVSKSGSLQVGGISKEKGEAGVQVRRGMLGRAARAKVWEGRIEEEEEEQQQQQNTKHLQQEAGRQRLAGGKEKMERGQVERVRCAGIKPRPAAAGGILKASRIQYTSGGGGASNRKTMEEIGVFDAERYFAGREQQVGWGREEEDELMEGEAGGDLPLSPLLDLIGKSQSWGDGGGGGVADRSASRMQAASAAGGGSRAAAIAGRRVESSEFTSPRTSTTSSLSEVEPPPMQHNTHSNAAANKAPSPNGPAGKPPKSKLQPASPSSRLATFLAKFKPPTPRKSPVSSPNIQQHPKTASTPPPPPPRHPASSVLSPAKKLFPQYTLGLQPAALNNKTLTSSPRGRFLRAFSSSSADHASGSPLRHHAYISAVVADAATPTPSSMAASSPVSPAARSAPDSYSPVVHSASTTPTSFRIPRSSAHSHSTSSARTTISQVHAKRSSSRHKLPESAAPNSCNSSGKLKQQLPFLSRKLKVYLMPDKAGRGARDQLPAKQEMFGKLLEGTLLQGDVVVGHAASKRTQEAKQRRRWLHAEDQVVDEDIELAERLLRVVQDHQSVTLSHNNSTWSRTCSGSGQAVQYTNGGFMGQSKSGGCNVKSYIDGVSEYSSRKYDQMHPTSTRMSTRSLSQISAQDTMGASYGGGGGAAAASRAGDHAPRLANYVFPGNPATQAVSARDISNHEGVSPYDSDSSSDLFEIETLASVGMGLCRRDLPVYEAKEPPFQKRGFNLQAVPSRPAR